MLILGRKVGQRVRIGDDIYVTVTEVNGPYSQVKLGFEAPKEIHIVREELIDAYERAVFNRKSTS